MRQRNLVSLSALAVTVGWMSVMPLGAQAQKSTATPRAAPAKKYTAPRTADGHPDLQGVWSFANLTPLERPSGLDGKDVLSDEEAAEFAKQTIERNNKDKREPGTTGDVSKAYNDFWWDFGNRASNRTSLIVDPPDGRIPALTAEAKKRQADRQEKLSRPAWGPEDRNLGERCILGFNSGPPMLPSAYNNNVQILQTPGYVVILNEMVHNARVVPMDGRPHGSVRQWVGDSRGRWEGETLVVDTINFSSDTSFRGSSPNMHLVERFTRVSPDTLDYAFTVEDATTWSRPWTVSVPMAKTDEQMYEYACHEGNYGMEGILAGARAQEKAAAAEARKSGSK